jgi:8-oxo-dGTP pyrophosphatase MutT (NUDIX family)
MSYRAAIILLKEDKVALIERHRQGQHYFTFPGGHVDEGETPEQAAVREAKEELGLDVTLIKTIARISWQGKWQVYYLVEGTGGTFGTGSGAEMVNPVLERGTYKPTWLPLSELLEQPVRPREMAELLSRFVKEGWPESPVILAET